MKPNIALQLWSISEACGKDLQEALKQVKAYGYDGVEFAGYYGNSAEEIKTILADTGLKVAGSHIPYDMLFQDTKNTLDFEEVIGNKNIVIPYATFETFEEWQAFISKMDKLSFEVEKRGMRLYYHNHAHELTEIENRDILAYIAENTEAIYLEADLYWLAHAGKDVLSWVETHKEKVGLFHIKERKENPVESTELGKGNLPLKAYVEKAKELDLEWLIVEQEAFQDLTPLEAAAENVQTLKALVEEVYA